MDNATPRELFNNYVSTTSASYGSLDSQNTIVFGNNGGTGVIAVHKHLVYSFNQTDC